MRSANAFNSEQVTLMPTTGIVAWHILAAKPYAVPTAQMSECFSRLAPSAKRFWESAAYVNSLNLYKK